MALSVQVTLILMVDPILTAPYLLMSNAYVDPWDMLNNFCFHVYGQILLFINENDNDFFALDPCLLVDQS